MTKLQFEQSAIWLLIAIYATLGFATMLSNPLLESPDELLNYENMRYIATHKSLPVLQAGEMSKAHHPPLYYLLGAIITGPIPDKNLEMMGQNINRFFGYRTYDFGIDNKSQYLHGTSAEAWPWHDAALGLYLMRIISIVLGAGGVLAIYKTGRILFAEQAVSLVAAAIVALNPMYVYIQSSVHNDALTNFLAACTILALVIYWQTPSMKQGIVIGTVAALGILTKITFLFLGPVVLVVIFGRHLISRKNDAAWLQSFLKNITVAGGIVIALTGWWFVRNQILYGEPTSMQLQASIWQPRPNAPDWAAAVQELGYLRDSFWGVFGFGQIVFPRWVYTTMNGLTLVACVGVAIWLFQAGSVRLRNADQRWLLGALLVAPITAFCATFSRMSVSGTANFGRYLFTTYGVLAMLFAIGLFTLVRLIFRGHRSADQPFAIVLSFGLIGLNLFGIFGVIRPVFAPPPVYAAADQVTPQFPFEIEFPGAAKLLGYSLEPRSFEPGGHPFHVTLYWQEVNGGTLENFTEFVQLVTPDEQLIEGRNTLHGLGRYPTSRWRPHEVVEDKVTLLSPSDTDIDIASLRLDIGLKDEAGQPVSLENGQTTLTIGLVRYDPHRGPIDPMPLYAFGDSIYLVDVDVPEQTVAPGSTLDITLDWQSAQPVTADYVVLMHWVKSGGIEPVISFDRPPADNQFPTSLWAPGDRVKDKHRLDIPADLPTGEYQLLIGLYHRSGSNFIRLPIETKAGESLPDQVIRFGPITVR